MALARRIFVAGASEDNATEFGDVAALGFANYNATGVNDTELNTTAVALNRHFYYVVEGDTLSSLAPTMLVLCYVLGGLLITLVTLYVTLELHYFLRMCLCVLLARFCKPRISILDDTYVHGVCITTDVDTLLYHMNNARYLRELDFARVDFYERTGLYRKIRQKGGAVVQGACTIRYRRFVRPFSVFKITSKVIYWDAKSVFMEHRFITPKDDFVRAIVVCQQRVIQCNAEDVISELLGPEATAQKPQLPLEVAKWIESNEISSANLRNGC